MSSLLNALNSIWADQKPRARMYPFNGSTLAGGGAIPHRPPFSGYGDAIDCLARPGFGAAGFATPSSRKTARTFILS
jgi:hypothetical protein